MRTLMKLLGPALLKLGGLLSVYLVTHVSFVATIAWDYPAEPGLELFLDAAILSWMPALPLLTGAGVSLWLTPAKNTFYVTTPFFWGGIVLGVVSGYYAEELIGHLGCG